MKTCPDCGERVYNLGCVNCNEPAYIEEQERLTDSYGSERLRAGKADVSSGPQATPMIDVLQSPAQTEDR